MTTPNSATATVGSPYDLVNGFIWYALADEATVPEDASSDIDLTVFRGLGYLSEDGLEVSEEGETTDLIAWGKKRLRVLRGTRAESIAFTPMQMADADVARFIWGDDNVEVDDDSGLPHIMHTNDDPPTYVIVVDSLVAPGLKERVVCESAQVSGRDTWTFKDDSTTGRKITCDLSVGSDGKTTLHEYFAEAE